MSPLRWMFSLRFGSAVLPGWRERLPTLVFLVGLVCTLGGWNALRNNEAAIEAARNTATADLLLHQIGERLAKVDLILRGTAGLFIAQSLIDRREFETYLQDLHVNLELPEVVGVGFAPRVGAARFSALQAMLSRTYGRQVQIRPVPTPASTEPIFPVVYFWPLDEAAHGAIGFDAYADPVRRRAIDTALRVDGMAMSAALKLRTLPGADTHVGVILYRVVHSSGGVGARTVAGVIPLVLNLDRIFSDVLDEVGAGYGLRVDDVTDGPESALFASSVAGLAGVAGVTRELSFGGRAWRLSIKAPPVPGLVPTSRVLALAGVAMSALLAILLSNLTAQRQRAQRLAESMTEELRDSEKRFALAVAATEGGIWEWRAGSAQLYLSSRCDYLLGYPEGRLPRSLRGILRSFSPEVRREFLLALRRHFLGRAPLDCVLPIHRIDGGEGWFHVTGRTEFGPGGKPVRSAGAASDVTELRRVQQAVVDSHAKLNALYRDSFFGMALVDGDGRYLQANAEFCRITAYTEDELLKLNSRVLTPPEYAARDVQSLVDNVQGRQSRPYDKEYFRKDGSRVPVAVTTTYVGGADRAHWVVAEDASARLASNKAIQEAHATNESLIDAMPDMLFQLDRDMRVLRYHASGQEPVMPPESFLGKRLNDVLAPETARRFGVAALAASRSGRLQRIEYSSRRDGQVRHFDARFRAVRTGGTLAVIRDVSDLKEAELALRESEARWQFALDGAGDGVWDWDITTGKVFRSIRWLTMLGYQSGDLGTSPEEWSHRVHADDLAATQDAQRAHLRGETPIFTCEFRMCCKDGRYKWILARGLVIARDARGRALRMIGTQTDIDEVKAREAEVRYHNSNLACLVEARTKDLVAAKEAAEAANEAKSLFLANMSHELRTPMHAVLSYAGLGETRAGTASVDKLRDYFQRIRTSGERLLLLLNDLLDLAKFEAGRMILNFTQVNLELIVRDSLNEFEALFRTRRLHVNFTQEGPEPVLEGDLAKIGQVLRNLLSNAAKFTPEGRALHIHIGPGSLPAGRRASDAQRLPALAITVSDEGVGIPLDELEDVFEKFVQSSRTRTGAGGTGLGLAICREIMEAHRGQISVRNNPAGGAEFTVVFPLFRAQPGSEPDASSQGSVK